MSVSFSPVATLLLPPTLRSLDESRRAPANTMSAPTVLASSTGSPYQAGASNRWGDYFGVDVDPVDDETFWGTAMVVRADGWWSTHVVSWTVSKTTTLAPASFLWVAARRSRATSPAWWRTMATISLQRPDSCCSLTSHPAQLQVEAVAPTGQVLNIDMLAIAMVNTPGLSQKIELWDWINSVYVQVGSTQVSTTSDSSHSASATGTLSNFVQAGTRTVRAKVSFFRTGLTFVFPWSASVDQFRWNIRTR